MSDSKELDNISLAKRTPSKRRSFIERAQKESEELVRTLGGSLELEGGRRTRSSARGTPARVSPALPLTPPASKRARKSPVDQSPAKAGRGRGRKLANVASPVTSELSDEPITAKENSLIAVPKVQTNAEEDVHENADTAEISAEEKSTDNQAVIADNLKCISEVKSAQNAQVVETPKTGDVKQQSSLESSTPMEVDCEVVKEAFKEKVTAPLEAATSEAHVSTKAVDVAEVLDSSPSVEALKVTNIENQGRVPDVVEIDSSSKSDDVQFVQDSSPEIADANEIEEEVCSLTRDVEKETTEAGPNQAKELVDETSTTLAIAAVDNGIANANVNANANNERKLNLNEEVATSCIENTSVAQSDNPGNADTNKRSIAVAESEALTNIAVSHVQN